MNANNIAHLIRTDTWYLSLHKYTVATLLEKQHGEILLLENSLKNALEQLDKERNGRQ
jgi:hypothetical protein